MIKRIGRSGYLNSENAVRDINDGASNPAKPNERNSRRPVTGRSPLRLAFKLRVTSLPVHRHARLGCKHRIGSNECFDRG